MFTLSTLFSTVGVLLGVAFFTLMERKIMGLMHYRKGPNKILIWGLLQPIADATKLLTKETSKLKPLNLFMFWFAPILGLFLMLSCWTWYENIFMNVGNSMKIFLIMAIMSLSAFVFMLTSWGSNTKYAILGGYRAISQIISYEVCFMVFIFVVMYLLKSYSTFLLKILQENWWMFLFSIPFSISWLVMCLAESNRTPFDMTEGESEIVSGFNIEYGGGLFAVIFIMEYGMIMFLGFLTTILLLGSTMTITKTLLVCFIFIWIRCCFPRMRYDKLMMLCWKIALPYSLSILTFSLIF